MNALSDILSRFVKVVAVRLPDDIYDALERLRLQENSQTSRLIYDVMFNNIRCAADRGVPLCQDTGVLEFFVDVGEKFPLIGELENSIREATIKASNEIPLRQNAVETFNGYNTGNNTGTRIPWVEWSIIPKADYADMTLYLAGGGCSLPGSAKVLPPVAGFKGVVRFVLDVISNYGLNACPPLLVGVGIGASSEIAAMLSKRALLRPVGERNKNKKAAQMEQLLIDKLDGLQLGPQGLGGCRSVLDVHVEYSARHPATYGIGVSTGCWAHRRGRIQIKSDLTYNLISYQGVRL